MTTGATLPAGVPVVRSATAAALAVVCAAGAFASALFIAATVVIVDDRMYFVLFDDAMISMRYAQHLAQGSGLVWNAGEPPVQGFSNLLWTLAMWAPHAAGLPPRLASLPIQLFGAATMTALTVLTWRVASLVHGRDNVPAIAAALTAGSTSLMFWSLRGMEVGAVSLSATGSVLCALRFCQTRRRVHVMWLCAAVLVGALLRHDAVLPSLAVAGWLWMGARRRDAAVAVVAAASVGVAIQVGFSQLCYGEWLPNTYYLKLVGISLSERLARGAASLALLTIKHLLPLLALGVLAFRTPSGRDSTLVLLSAVFLVHPAYSVWTGGDAWEWMPFANRFIAPGLPVLTVLSAIGITRAAGNPRSVAAGLLVGAAQPLVWWACLMADRGIDREIVAAYRAHPATYASWSILVSGVLGVAAAVARRKIVSSAVFAALVLALVTGPLLATIALWGVPLMKMDAFGTRLGTALDAALPADATVAVTAAGTVPYFAARRAIDVRGKNDPVIARGRPAAPFWPGHNKWDLEHSIGRMQPHVACGLPIAHGQREYLSRLGYVETPSHCFLRADTAVTAPKLLAAFGPEH